MPTVNTDQCVSAHMSLFETIRTAVDEMGPDEADGPQYAGAYWCDDCARREPVTEDEIAATDGRTCDDCGGEMRLERSFDSGDCAC